MHSLHGSKKTRQCRNPPSKRTRSKRDCVFCHSGPKKNCLELHCAVFFVTTIKIKNLFSIFLFVSQCGGFVVKDKPRVSTRISFKPESNSTEFFMRHSNKRCSDIGYDPEQTPGPVFGRKVSKWNKWVIENDGRIRSYNMKQRCPLAYLTDIYSSYGSCFYGDEGNKVLMARGRENAAVFSAIAID